MNQLNSKGEQISVEVGPASKNWVPSHQISRLMKASVVAAEDGRFYQHSGFDFVEIIRSVKTNIKKNRYARGGSTISQQLIKIAFLSHEKSIIRKVREAIGTMLLEFLLEKDEILTWYLNLVQFGDGIYGINQAAFYYFSKKPKHLNLDESIRLAAILPSPIKWSRGIKTGNYTAFMKKRHQKILKQLLLGGYV